MIVALLAVYRLQVVSLEPDSLWSLNTAGLGLAGREISNPTTNIWFCKDLEVARN